MSIVGDIATRLTAQVPSRTVYAHAVPDGPLPAQYLVVRASEGSEGSTRVCATTDTQTPSVWVTSVARNANPQVAAQECAWAAGRVRVALRDWTPGVWPVTPETSQGPTRDESIPATTFYAVEQFSVRTNL